MDVGSIKSPNCRRVNARRQHVTPDPFHPKFLFTFKIATLKSLSFNPPLPTFLHRRAHFDFLPLFSPTLPFSSCSVFSGLPLSAGLLLDGECFWQRKKWMSSSCLRWCSKAFCGLRVAPGGARARGKNLVRKMFRESRFGWKWHNSNCFVLLLDNTKQHNNT